MYLRDNPNNYTKDSVKGGHNDDKMGKELTCFKEKWMNVFAFLGD